MSDEWWRVPLTWHGDADPEAEPNPKGEENEPEFTYLEPGQESPTSEETPEVDPEPEKIALTAEEWEERQKELIKGTLAGVQTPAPSPATSIPQQPDESDADFRKRFNEEVFTSQDAYGFMEQMLVRQVGPVIQRQQGVMVQQERELLLLKEERARQYEGEIDAAIASLPPNQRNQTGIYRTTYMHVLSLHQSDIIAEEVAKQVAAATANGDSDEPDTADPVSRRGAPKTKPSFSEKATGAQPKKRRQVSITATQKAQFERRAEELGIDYDDYIKSEFRA